MSEVFEWALIRVVPRVERGEAINAGVIVYSKWFRYLKTKVELDEQRLLSLDPGADVAAVRAALTAFERACANGPLAEFTRPGPRRRYHRPRHRPHPSLRRPGHHVARRPR
jgi:hypothetical protein